MNVVTLSRQLGSLGYETAEILAQRSGYRLVGRELISHAAKLAGAPEVALAMFDELNLLGLKPAPHEIQAYLDAVNSVMHELAAAGCVIIVGRAGQIILANRPGVLHVRLTAPLPIRVERLTQRQGITHAAAQAQAAASDRYHKQYFKNFYHTQWDFNEHYDLVINSARLSQEQCVALITPLLDPCPPAANPFSGAAA